MLRLVKELASLRRALRAGVHPQDLGMEAIGAGAFRTAYANDRWVVKMAMPSYAHGWRQRNRDRMRQERVKTDKHYRSLFRYAPLVRVYCVSYPRGWDIMRRYQRLGSPNGVTVPPETSPVTRAEQAAMNIYGTGDLHQGNLGRDHRNRLVAFDP